MATGLHIPEPEFSRKIEIARIGDAPIHIEAVATAEECAALAPRLDVLAVSRLSIRATLGWNARRTLIEVTGSASAVVSQNCVVSLEPMDVEVDVSFARLYTPGSAGRRDAADGEFAADEDEPPEPIPEDGIDVGEVAVEQLLLSLDPYPRKPDTEVPAAYAAGAPGDEKENPFAVLQRLKQAH